jgi:hypothetical protein
MEQLLLLDAPLGRCIAGHSLTEFSRQLCISANANARFG